MHDVKAYKTAEVELGLATRMVGLVHRAWPSDPPVDPEDAARQVVAEARAYSGPAETAPMCYAVIEGTGVQAVAYTFARTIGTESGEMMVLALAGVVVDETSRGTGLGRAVVQAAFERVNSGMFSFSLFQTEPHNQGFYEKLGAACVDNRIVNSLSPDGPDTPGFWDELALVYPVHPDWPGGVIDLRGPGY